MLTKLQPTVPVIIMRLSSNFYDYYAHTMASSKNFQSDDISHQHQEYVDDTFDDYYIRGSCPRIPDDYPQPKTDSLRDIDQLASNSSIEHAEVDSKSRMNSGNVTDSGLKYQMLFFSPYVRQYKPEVDFSKFHSKNIVSKMERCERLS